MKFFSKHNKFLFLGIFIALVVFGLSAFFTTTFAQDVFGTDPIEQTTVLGGADIRVTIVKIINVALGLLGIVALGIVLWGGYMYMTAGGNEERVGTAKKILINGTIGLVIILSSFAITQYVLNKLAEATNIVTTPPNELDGSCSEPGTPYYEKYHNTSVCSGYCALYPSACCFAEHFVVKSITPSTPKVGESTGLYNDTIRVLFSKEVAGSADKVFKIFDVSSTGSKTEITNDFNFYFSNTEGKVLVEAIYKNIEQCSDVAGATHCLKPGSYEISVSAVKDLNGNDLETQVTCGTFPKDATFKIDSIEKKENYLDKIPPSLSKLLIDNKSSGNIKLAKGETYEIKITSDDRFTNTSDLLYGGNAFVSVKVYKEGQSGSLIKTYIDGPLVNNGSSPVFNFLTPFKVPNNLQYNTNYIVEAVSHDIDGNQQIEINSFMVVPETCANGILDAGETGIDSGGICGGGDGESCKIQTDCSQWYKCLDTQNQLCNGKTGCTCTPWPYIEEVEYMNGDVGNWITIKGYNFGSATGTVRFNYIATAFTQEIIEASFPQCQYGKVWTDSWIIAEVPPKGFIKIFDPTISVVASSTSFEDFTDDDFGSDLGRFHFNGIKRPGLCSVTVSAATSFDMGAGVLPAVYAAGSTIAPATTPIIAEGKGFGNFDSSKSKLTFDIFDAFVESGKWTDTTVNSIVPFAKPGKNGVYITASSGEKSNSVPFEVVDTKDLFPPVITQIDPATTTRGSYITIYGTNFGNTKGVVTIDGKPTLDPPDYCGSTWKDDQIIVKVPFNAIEDGNKKVVVTRGDNNLSSNGTNTVEIVEGVPKPSICYLSPNTGSAPLSSGQLLTIKGEYFANPDTVYFWSQEAQKDKEDTTWLKTIANYSGITSIEMGKILKTNIPVESSKGYTMITGPIKIKNSLGYFSNSIKYTVTDCREPGTGTIPGFQCCQEGDEAGQWKISGFMCKGEDREAGYVWRFTTGKIPDKFFVLEQCGTGSPSPSPSTYWAQGKSACVNARLQAKFSLNIDATTIGTLSDGLINNSNVRIFQCGTGGEPNCNNATDVTGNFVFDVSGTQLVRFSKNKTTPQTLDPKTWYRVVFSSSVQSIQKEIILGQEEYPKENLLSTKPCEVNGFKGAYCFEFRTGAADNICTLIGAGIEPNTYTTTLLGVIQNPAYNFMYDINNVFNPLDPNIHPVFFDVYGIANQECTVIDVDDKKWTWGPIEPPEDPNTASGHKFVTTKYLNSRGVAKAWKNNVIGSDIYAQVTENNTQTDITPILGNAGIFTVSVPYEVKNLVDVLETDTTNVVQNPFYISADVTLNSIPTSTSGFIKESSGIWIKYRNIFRIQKQAAPEKGISLSVLEKVLTDAKVSRMLVLSYTGTSNPKTLTLQLPQDTDTFEVLVSFGNEKTPAGKEKVSMKVDVGGNQYVAQHISEGYSFVGDPLKYIIGSNNKTDNKGLLYGSIKKLEMYKDTTNDSLIKATSTIKIDLENPQVVSKWPSCIEACINAEIGVQFNQIMGKNTYFNPNGMELYKCSDETCINNLTPVGLTQNDNQTETILREYPQQYLEPATWYLAKIKDTIKALGGMSGGNPQLGKSVMPIQWKFRTKTSAEPCVVDNVKIYPDPFVAYFIGQKTQYSAMPKGAPDSCSPYGQFLNPWDYGWNWSSDDENVVSVSDFALSKNLKPYCTNTCLPAGSDIAKSAKPVTYSICGNGIVDPGEDCDIASETPYGEDEKTLMYDDISGKLTSGSCTYSCLRPGNSKITTTTAFDNQGNIVDFHNCGDGFVSYLDGEECDPNDSDLKQTNADGKVIDYSPYCSDTCLWTGSTAEQTGDPAKPICGSGSITTGEDCDIAKANTKGCSNSCLNVGTPLEQYWCDTKANKTEIEEKLCKLAGSICGNGKLEFGEECDFDKNNVNFKYCDDSCLLINVCDTPLEQCKKDEEGCNIDCTFAGSSILYSEPSLCGDGGLVGIGENAICELSDADYVNDLGQNPIQIATAQGLQNGTTLDEVVDKLETQIHARPANYLNPDGTVSSTNQIIEGIGDYTLMCGHKEYTTIDEFDNYNDCPLNTGNVLGVAANSCCYERPMRMDQYPAVNAGIGTEDVCRNTYIEAVFDKKMDAQSFTNNVHIAQGYTTTSTCDTAKGERELTDEEQASYELAYVGSGFNNDESGFWDSVWEKVKHFFAKLFGGDAFAVEINSTPTDVGVWCMTDIVVKPLVSYNYTYNDEDKVIGVTSTVSLYINKLLDPEVYVAVLFDGGPDKIRDMSGVAIKSPFTEVLSRDDYWLFKTRDEICKIDHINVTPELHVFTFPQESQDFKVDAITAKNESIVKIIGVYDWQWSWHPENPLFDIPSSTLETVTVTSTGIEGSIDGVSKAKIITDIDTDVNKNQTGKVFTDMFGLVAFYCGNPWPNENTASYADSTLAALSSSIEIDPGSFQDTKFNFSMRYCADTENPLTKLDDLPLFDSIQYITDIESLGGITTQPSDTLRRYLLFSTTTDDVIGIQVFKGEPKADGSFRTLEEWYVDRFGDLNGVQLVSVGGYEALTDGLNYYVHAYNVDTSVKQLNGEIWGNIYLFSVNQNASEKTLNAFNQLIKNLQFNINLSNHNKCLNTSSVSLPFPVIQRLDKDDISDTNCTTNFDCIDEKGVAKSGLSGSCSNVKTRLFRDLTRLQDLHTIQSNLDLYFETKSGTDDFIGTLSSGSFIPGYSNSKWNNSWSLLNQNAGAIPVDPINTWAGCDEHDPLTCWNAASSTFKCPQVSQVYEYKYVSSTESYNFYAPFEFLSWADTGFGIDDSYLLNQFIDENKIIDGRSCSAGQVQTVYDSICGDGVLNPTVEQCDPPGKKQIDLLKTGCTTNQVGQKECNAQCQWSASTCVEKINKCGNGIKEGSEVCDDGVQNGTYGHCKKDCTGQMSNSCGNGQLDYDSAGNPLEFCDTVTEGGKIPICKFTPESGVQSLQREFYFLLDLSSNMTEERLKSIKSQFKKVSQSLAEYKIGIATFSGDSDVTEILPVGVYSQAKIDSTINGIVHCGSDCKILGNAVVKAVTHVKEKIFTIPNESVDRNVVLVLPYLPYTFRKDQSNYLLTQDIAKNIKYLKDNLYVSTYILIEDVNAGESELNSWASAGGTDQYIPYSVNTDKLSEEIKKFSASCLSYFKYKNRSCSWDCQSIGGYCGDKIVQWSEDEKCDDGNENNDDACKNNCKVNSAPASVCGNGFIEGNETCDDNNKTDGDGCSAKCQDESIGAECGDGKKNQEQEQCDLGKDKNGLKCTPEYNSSCTYCREDCIVETVESPYQCGNGKIDYIGGQAKEGCDYKLFKDQQNVWFIPFGTNTQKQVLLCDDTGMVSYVGDSGKNTFVGKLSCDSTCKVLNTSQCIECGVIPSGVSTQLAILNVMTGGDSTKYSPSWSNVLELSLFQGVKPLGAFDFSDTIYSNYKTFPFGNGLGLQNSQQCSYEVFFNPDEDNIYTDKKADFFPYGGAMLNEIILSPALPPGDLRVVVRWDKTKDQNIKFVGNFVSKKNNFSSYLGTELCNFIELSVDHYWKPSCNSSSGYVWVHELIERGNTGVQAYTFADGDDGNIGFMVSSPNGPINYFKGYDVWVDVYYPHEGQSPKYSLFKPDFTFSLKDAKSSENTTAAYWHVFNIKQVNGDYKIYEIGKNSPKEITTSSGIKAGAIKTNTCEVKADVPLAVPCTCIPGVDSGCN